MANLFKKHRCFATICTNGLLIDRYQEIIRNNPYLVFLISLDGLAKENDAIRGTGVFQKVIGNIKLLKKMKKPPYLGVQFTIMPENVAGLFDFCREMVALGVDWILLNPTWFLTENQARAYEAWMKNNYNFTPKTQTGYLFPYSPDVEEFGRQYLKIKKNKWPIQISCYFKKADQALPEYVRSDQFAPDCKTCYKQWFRLEILPSGEVTPCSRFPDLIFGDLNKQDVLSIWNSDDFVKFRKLASRQLLPVCNRCNCLYLYDAERKYL